MLNLNLFLNKLVALVLICAGALPIAFEGDGTVLVFFLPIALLLIFSKKNCLTIEVKEIVEDEEDMYDTTSEAAKRVV